MISVSGSRLVLLACVISVHMYGCIDARSTSGEQATDEGEVIDYKVIIKREARDELEEYPPVEGRTFRASEPLDPNGPLTQVLRKPFGIDPFETVNTIFQPVVEEIDENNPSEEVTENDESNENEDVNENEDITENEHTDEIAEETNSHENPTADDLKKDNEIDMKPQEYGAQYPYPETSSRQYTGHVVGSSQDTGYVPGDLDRPGYQAGVVEPVSSQDGHGYRRYATSANTRENPYQERVVSRRVVVTGSGGSDPSSESGYDTRTTDRRVVVRGGGTGGASSYDTQTGSGQDGQTGYETRTTNRRVVVRGSGYDGADGYDTHTGTGQDGQTGYETRTTNRRVVVRGSGAPDRAQTGTDQRGQTGYDTRTTHRRVVVRGQSGQNGYNTQTVTDQRSQSGYTEPETQRARTNGNFPNLQQPEYRSGNDDTTYHFYNRQYQSGSDGTRTNERRTYTPATRSNYERQNSGEMRGAYYGGEVFYDNNGHKIDANGRHLDSTGRYYDISGRYRDAVVTRTVTYGTSGGTASRYTDPTDTSYSGGTRGHGGSGGGYTGGRGSESGRTSGGGGGGGSETVYTRQYVSNTNGGRAVDSYGGTQFYSGGGSSSRPQTYDPVSSFISSDPTCPQTNNRVTINGLSCNDAISQLGSFVCYNYERVSTECCERCLQVKRPDEEGCEYGDRSHQCRNIQPSDCYQPRNRQICCSRCNHFLAQLRGQAVSGCEYGDLTPRCQTMVAQRPHLCYLPENQRLCCSTCPRLAHREQSDCQWGNQSPELCEPFDRNGRVRINCYLQAVQEVCCATCQSLRDRMPDNISGCEYGDSPVQFSTSHGLLDCGQYLRQYGMDECETSQEVASKCCYTCYRYRNRRG